MYDTRIAIGIGGMANKHIQTTASFPLNALKLAVGIKKENSQLIKMPGTIAFRDELGPESEAMDDFFPLPLNML
jgi:hypothetical protein